MWEREIHAAGVNVERLTEIFHSHRGTLDMPARAAFADGCLPEMLAGLRRFPEGEIARVGFFVLVHIHSRACLDAGHINFRELAVLRKLRNSIVNRALAVVSVGL